MKQHATASQAIISLSTATLLLGSFGLSPRFARHPYLLWMTLSVGLGFLVPQAIRTRSIEALDEAELAEQGRGRSGQEMRINGEVVRDSMNGWTKVLAIQGAVWGVGWAMGTVGLWGERY